ncbi:hypothetical protein GA0115233_11661, partial [Streptomyces sp. DI166]
MTRRLRPVGALVGCGCGGVWSSGLVVGYGVMPALVGDGDLGGGDLSEGNLGGGSRDLGGNLGLGGLHLRRWHRSGGLGLRGRHRSGGLGLRGRYGSAGHGLPGLALGGLFPAVGVGRRQGEDRTRTRLLRRRP